MTSAPMIMLTLYQFIICSQGCVGKVCHLRVWRYLTVFKSGY